MHGQACWHSGITGQPLHATLQQAPLRCLPPVIYKQCVSIGPGSWEQAAVWLSSKLCQECVHLPAVHCVTSKALQIQMPGQKGREPYAGLVSNANGV